MCDLLVDFDEFVVRKQRVGNPSTYRKNYEEFLAFLMTELSPEMTFPLVSVLMSYSDLGLQDCTD